MRSGGGGGIRTHGTLSRTPVFKTGAFDHSATPPTSAPYPAAIDSKSTGAKPLQPQVVADRERMGLQ